MRLSFAECVVDFNTRQLSRGGEPLPLPAKVFELLALLVAERPRALSKQEIRDRLWPGTFVTESNLTSLMSDLRAALGDDARHPRCVRTVHGHGYAFCGVVEDGGGGRLNAKTAFRLYCQDREIALREGENVLGRTDDAAVWIDSATVSRRHARLLVADGRVRLEDLGSRNGTWVRGQRIGSPVELSDGEEFRVGRVPVTVRVMRAGSSTRSSTRG